MPLVIEKERINFDPPTASNGKVESAPLADVAVEC
jgi:hypothetical protein